MKIVVFLGPTLLLVLCGTEVVFIAAVARLSTCKNVEELQNPEKWRAKGAREL